MFGSKKGKDKKGKDNEKLTGYVLKSTTTKGVYCETDKGVRIAFPHEFETSEDFESSYYVFSTAHEAHGFIIQNGWHNMQVEPIELASGEK